MSSSRVPTTRSDDEIASGNTLTEFQKNRLLGHYSTLDGVSGFILDRTGPTCRAKIDGNDRILELRVVNHTSDYKVYQAEEGNILLIWLRVREDGRVLLFRGPKQHEGVQILRDASARPL